MPIGPDTALRDERLLYRLMGLCQPLTKRVRGTYSNRRHHPVMDHHALKVLLVAPHADVPETRPEPPFRVIRTNRLHTRCSMSLAGRADTHFFTRPS